MRKGARHDVHDNIFIMIPCERGWMDTCLFFQHILPREIDRIRQIEYR